MPSKSQKKVEKIVVGRLRRALGLLLIALIVFSDSPIAVWAAEFSPAKPQFLASDLLTPELTKLAEAKPELSQTHSETRKEKIQAASDSSAKWTERLVAAKLENGSKVADVLGKRKDAEKVVANLKAAGALTTLADATTGEEKEIDPNLKSAFGEPNVFKTVETPYAAELSTQSSEPIVLSENSQSAGDVVSSATSDQQVAEDATPETREEVRYFNWDANEVDGSHEENKILYRDLWKSTDLLVTAGETGTKEDLVLKDANAPTVFNYIVETVGLKLQMTEDGGYVFIDENGNEKFRTPAPNITDANGQLIEDGIRYELGWGAAQQPAADTDSVLSEIKFDENSGQTFADQKSQQVGSLGGAKWSDDGFQKSALLFDGESAAAKIDRDFAIPQQITLSAWVKSGAYQNSEIVSLGRNSLSQDSQKGWRATFRVGDKNFTLAWKNTTLYLEKWYHLVATFDGSKIRLFVDGTEQDSLDAAGSLAATADPILIGGEGGFVGAVDEVKIFGRALSAEEIASSHEKDLQASAEVEIKVIDESELPNSSSPTEATDEIQVVEEADLTSTSKEIPVVDETNSTDSASSDEAIENPQDANSETETTPAVEPQSTDSPESIPVEENSQDTENTETALPAENLAEPALAPTENSVAPTPTENSTESAPAGAPTSKTPAEAPTSFFQKLKNFFAPTALAAIEKFDESVSIDSIVDSNDVVEGVRDSNTAPENSVPVNPTVNVAEPVVVPDTETPAGDSAPATSVEVPTQETIAPTADQPDEAAAQENSTADISADQNSSTEIPTDTAVTTAIESDANSENPVSVSDTTDSGAEIQVVEESEVNKFFAPEASEEAKIEIAPNAEIVVLTEQEAFAQSSRISEEIKTDTMVIRRYKLRLVIDVRAAAPAETTPAPAIESAVEQSAIDSANEAAGENNSEPENTVAPVESTSNENVENSSEVIPATESESAETVEPGSPENPAAAPAENQAPATDELAPTENSTQAIPAESTENSIPQAPEKSEIKVIDEATPAIELEPPAAASAAENSAELQPENLQSSILDATSELFSASAAETDLPKTLTLANGIELTFPLDLDPSTYIVLVNRGARTFAPNFAEGSPSGANSQVNTPGLVNRGAEDFFPADLVGSWNFDQNYLDQAGNALVGTWNDPNSSGQAFPLGKFNRALGFDGIDDYLDIGDTAQTVKATSFWIFANNDSRDVVDFDSGSHFVSLAGGTLTATGFDTPTIYVDGSLSSTISTGAWHHVAITTATGFTVDALKIGKSTTFFDGKIDDFTLFSRALAADEVAALYRGGRVAAANPQVLAIDASGSEFPGDAITDSQDWTAADSALRSNTIGSKIQFTTPLAAAEIWAGFNLSASGGVIRVTIDKGTDQEISNEIDTFASSTATSQKVLLATGLRNTVHAVELELLPQTNPLQADSTNGSAFRFNLAYLETHANSTELTGFGLASTADSGSTTTLVDEALTQADDYWKGSALEFTSGANNGQTVFVESFDATAHTLIFSPAVSSPVTTETFRLSPNGLKIQNRAARGLKFNSTNAQNAVFGSLENFPVDTAGSVKKGTFSIWVAPDFASDADNAKHFVFDSGLARLYYDGADDKFKFEIWDGNDFTTADLASAAQEFSAHDSLHLAASWDSATGIKLFINGVKTAKSVAWTGQALSTGDAQIAFGKCGTRSAAEFTASQTYFSGTLAEPQLWNYVLLDSEIFGVYNSAIPSVGQAHTQKIEARTTNDATLLFNTPLTLSPNDRVGSLAGSAKLDSVITGDTATVSAADGQEPNWIENGRVAYWKMDGNFTDSAGTNDGTANGGVTATATGKFGSAAAFDGSDDYIDVPSSQSLNINTNAVSLGAWVKLNVLPSAIGDTYQGIFDSNEDAYIMYLDGFNDKLRCKFTDSDGTSERPGINSADLTVGVWNYIACVYDGATHATIYLNGVPKEQITNAGLTGNVLTGQHAALGRDGANNQRYFNGSIDDFAIYNRALSATEIAQLYQKDSLKFYGDPLAQSGGILNSDGLVGLWKMDGDFTDSFGSLEATTNGGATFDAGRFNQAVAFDGSDDYLDVGDTARQVRSASFWVYAENGSRGIADFDGGSHSIVLANGSLTATGFTAPKLYVDGVESSQVSLNAWHHIAITTATGFTASALKIGKNSTFFDGRIDEFALFDRVLSLDEIAAIYAAQPGGYFAFETPEATKEIVAGLDTGPDRGIARITVDGGTPHELKTEIDTFAPTAATNQRFLVAGGLTSGTHTVKVENSGVKNLSSSNSLVVPKFVETHSSGSVETNSLAINSQIVDGALVPDFTDFANGLVFPAKGNISQIQNTGSLEFWATGALASGDHFVDTRDASGHNGARLYMNSANSLTFEFQNASTSVSIVDADFASTYSAAAANHILARWWRPTATTLGLSLYLNGQKVAENIAQSFTPSTHSQIILGNDSTPDATADFDGSIYDFAIYSKAFDDGGAALGAWALPNSEVWNSYHSRATETSRMTSLQIDSGTTVNATDAATKTFYLDHGALARQVFAAVSYTPENRDTDIPLRLAAEDNVELAQQFQVSSAGTVPAVSLWLKKVGLPTGDISLEIQTDTDGLPSGSAVADGTATAIAVDSLSAQDYQWVTFNFPTAPSLTAGTIYHLVLQGTFAASAENNLVWAADTNSPDYADGTNEIKDAAWTESSEDFIFKIYENRSLANSIEAFVAGREVALSSAKAGSFARLNATQGISPLDTSFSIDSIVAATEIPASGFLWLGNPTADLKREKVFYGSYAGGTFSDLRRGIAGTTPGDWADNTIVEVAGTITLASAPATDSDLFFRYDFSGAAVERDSNTAESSIFFLDESDLGSTGWVADASASNRTSSVAGQTALAKLRGSEISAVLDKSKETGGISQFVIDEGTRAEKRILVDASEETALEKIKSLATDLGDSLHTLRIVANIATGKNSAATQTRLSAFQANGHAPLLEPAASSEILYAEPLADLNPEEIPDNKINLENAIGGNDKYTKLLIHSDTTDGATTFEDSSKSMHTITTYGDTHHESDQKKFGDSSIYFDGTGDYLSVADSDDWNFADQDFTIDLWARFNNIDQNYALMGQKTDNDNRWDLNVDFGSSRGAYFTMGAGASIVTISQGSNSGWAANTWYHIALVRHGSDWNIYRDGVSIASTTDSDIIPDFSGILRIAQNAHA
ncbi:MAG: LamG-like jellyroll fold domain-containing protein, partial [Patescibacteria group bacterium]